VALWRSVPGTAATPTKPHSALDDGFRSLYDLRFAEARETFARWQASHPDDPMGHTAEAAAYLFEEFERHGVLTAEFFLDDARLLGGIAGQADEARTRQFEQVNERARHLALQELGRNSRDANALLAMFMCTGMQADYANLIQKRPLQSLRLIRQAEDYARRLLAVTPEMADGYMALGAANYIIGSLPMYKRAVLWFVGIRGDRQKGMEQLALAARDGRYLRAYAKVLLALTCLREKQTARARDLLGELTAEYPESPLFARERAKLDRIAPAP
jgi:hypothetical protein